MSTSTLALPADKAPCIRALMESMGDRAKARRAELGLSQTEVGERAGGLKYQSIQQIEAGGGSKHIVAIARALNVRPEWLQDGTLPKEAMSDGDINNANNSSLKLPKSSPASKGLETDNKIKVLGMAECGPDGESLWNGDVVDYVPRPPMLAGAIRGYAVFAQGSSMEPRYHAGEIVYIHPDKPPTPGCYVLVQLASRQDGMPPRAFLKRLVRRSASKVVLEQYDPKKTFDLKASEIISIHRVVGSGET